MPPIEILLERLRDAVLVPALVAAALMAVACCLARWHAAIAHVGSALALAAGLAAGSWWCGALPELSRVPGPAAWEWLPWIVVAALFAGALIRHPSIPDAAGWTIRGALATHAGWLLTPREMQHEHYWVPLLLGTAILLEWAVLELLGRSDRAGLVPLAVVPAAMAASAVLIYAACDRFSIMATILMASLIAIGIVALACRRESGGIAAGVAIMLPGLLLAGQYETFSEVPIRCFLLAALAPLALAPSLLPVWRRHQMRGLWLIQLIILLAPVAAAVFFASQTGPLTYE